MVDFIMAESLPAHMRPERSFQGLILTLQRFWADRGCVILQPYDMEVGAGTFHPATTLRALGPKPWNAAYVQPSRRPKDGRYGENPNRLQHYYQFQVILKPSPPDLQDLYLKSLEAIGVDAKLHDIRFVEDDWESPTLGAWGSRLGAGATAWRSRIHLLPAGRGLRVRAGRGRADLRPGAPRDVRAGVVTHNLNFNGREGAEKVSMAMCSAGRAGVLAAQFRALRHRHALAFKMARPLARSISKPAGQARATGKAPMALPATTRNQGLAVFNRSMRAA